MASIAWSLSIKQGCVIIGRDRIIRNALKIGIARSSRGMTDYSHSNYGLTLSDDTLALAARGVMNNLD